MKEEEEDRSYIKPVSRILFLVAVALLVVPVFSTHFSPVSFLSIVAAMLLVPVTIGIRSWVNYKFFSNN